MTTILSEQSVLTLPARSAAGDDLWLSVRDTETATGWTLKPEGFCKGDICVPVPPARVAEFVGDDEVNVAALWRLMGLPYARDASGETWALGTSAAERSSQLQSLQAPDFSLPDLEGNIHSLDAQRGRKVLLVSWASW